MECALSRRVLCGPGINKKLQARATSVSHETARSWSARLPQKWASRLNRSLQFFVAYLAARFPWPEETFSIPKITNCCSAIRSAEDPRSEERRVGKERGSRW